MKKQFATLLMGIFLIQAHLFAYNFELNTSYDYFRGLPDGSWSGNTGVFWLGNFGTVLYDCVGVQVGGSYGLYNWDGRQNLVFKNPKALQQQAFVTTGLFSSIGPFNGGLVYDRLFTKHFGIYDRNPSIDQLRFQIGYQCFSEELGVWGTVHLRTSHHRALGVPISFRAIDQINFFWTHYFANSAKTTVWIGGPYRGSLRFHLKKPAEICSTGFSLRVPLSNCLFVDGHGSYIWAQKAHGVRQSRNYNANICIGLTYLFGNERSNSGVTYMPVANNSIFLVDTNFNQ